jgi:nitroreductase
MATAPPGIFEIMSTCRAMRYLRSDPVPDELVRTLIWAATRAPNPSNTQPWHFVVVDDDRSRIEAIGREVATAMAARAAARTPSDGPIVEGRFRDGHHLAQHLGEVPVLILVAAGLSYPPSNPEERYIWSTVYPASQNPLLAARALGLGLGATLTTLHHFAPHAFHDVLDIPNEIRIGSVIRVGWPARPFRPVRRKPVAEVLHYNNWSNGATAEVGT